MDNSIGMERTAIVILNWNGEDHLRRFLPSVIKNTPEGVGIWVADNGSTDGSVIMLQTEFDDVGIIRLDRNYGFAEGYNLALADPLLSGSRYTVLLNSDVETPPGWLEPLVSALDSDASLAAVAPKILSYRDRGSFEYAGAAGGFIDILGYPFCRGRILSRVEPDHGQYDNPCQTFWATGACMVVRTEVFRDLGGFDGDFFAHMEEIDFCWRAQLAGWKVGVVPASRVYHLGGGTLGADSPRKLYLNYRNNLCMLYKNLPRCGRRSIIPARMVADGLSAMVYLLTFRFGAFRAVWQAHRDYRKQKSALRTKREQFVARYGEPAPFKNLSGVYRGSVILRYIFGKRKFGNIIEIETLYRGSLLVDSRYLDRDDSGYLYYKGQPFSGLCGYYRKDGTLSSYIEYYDSYPHGKSEKWYESGQLKEEACYEEGCTVGVRKEWYESGQLKKQVEKETPTNYIVKEWYESGQIKSESHVVLLKQQLLKEWDEEGNLINEERA